MRKLKPTLYDVAETFYSIQGEGHHAGRPAWFIRLAGCNLKCNWCDTDHKPRFEMTAVELLNQVVDQSKSKFLVITGGEPTQQSLGDLFQVFKEDGWEMAVESNGTGAPTQLIPADWVTISPKALGRVPKEIYADEIKFVLDEKIDPNKWLSEHSVFSGSGAMPLLYIQPVYGPRFLTQDSIERAVSFVKEDPKWRLSIQTQKLLNIR